MLREMKAGVVHSVIFHFNKVIVKNKKVTYLLIVLVITVWGLIIYRVILAWSGDDEGKAVIPETGKREVFNDYAEPKDTAHLMQNYRDPFGLVRPKDTLVRSQRAAVGGTVTVKQAPLVMNWDFIRYVGYIRNPGSKALIAMIHVNGQELMLGEGESAGQLRLLKNLRDSIKINYNGKIKFIVIKPASL